MKLLKINQKKQCGGFLSRLLVTLGARSFRNLLTNKTKIRAG